MVAPPAVAAEVSRSELPERLGCARVGSSRPKGKTMKKTTLGTVVLATMGLALPAAALGDLPAPKDPTIEVAKSLGGIKMGMDYKKAEKKWGHKGDCTFDAGTVGNCEYYKVSHGTNDYTWGGGNIQVSGGKVVGVSIGAGRNEK